MIPPSDLAPPSATISISLSNVNVISFIPLNGTGVCPERTASELLPFTLFIRSVTSTGSNKVPLDVAIFILLLIHLIVFSWLPVTD